MILTIPMELEEAKKVVKVEFDQVDKETFEIIKKNIFNHLGISIIDTSNFIWEQFVENSNICGEFAWRYIEDLIPQGEYYLFFNQIECKNAYLFKKVKIYVILLVKHIIAKCMLLIIMGHIFFVIPMKCF